MWTFRETNNNDATGKHVLIFDLTYPIIENFLMQGHFRQTGHFFEGKIFSGAKNVRIAISDSYQ